MQPRRTHRDLLHILAFGHLRHRAPERAVVLLLLALRQAPEDRTLLTALALALLRAGRPAEALEVVERATAGAKPHGGGATWRLLRSRALLGLNRKAEARAEFAGYVAARSVPE